MFKSIFLQTNIWNRLNRHHNIHFLCSYILQSAAMALRPNRHKE